jgi:hypothetical protein
MKTQETIQTLETLLGIQGLILQAEQKESLLRDTLRQTQGFISSNNKLKLFNDIDTVRLAIQRLNRRYNTIKLSIFK